MADNERNKKQQVNTGVRHKLMETIFHLHSCSKLYPDSRSDTSNKHMLICYHSEPKGDAKDDANSANDYVRDVDYEDDQELIFKTILEDRIKSFLYESRSIVILSAETTGSLKSSTLYGCKNEPGLILKVLNFMYDSIKMNKKTKILKPVNCHDVLQLNKKLRVKERVAKRKLLSHIPQNWNFDDIYRKSKNHCAFTANSTDSNDQEFYYSIWVSFISLGDQCIMNMLVPLGEESKNLCCHYDYENNTYIEGQRFVYASNAAEAYKAFMIGRNRMKERNEEHNFAVSEMPHPVFQIVLVKHQIGTEKAILARFSFCDIGDVRPQPKPLQQSFFSKACPIGFMEGCVKAMALVGRVSLDIGSRDETLVRLFEKALRKVDSEDIALMLFINNNGITPGDKSAVLKKACNLMSLVCNKTVSLNDQTEGRFRKIISDTSEYYVPYEKFIIEKSAASCTEKDPKTADFKNIFDGSFNRRRSITPPINTVSLDNAAGCSNATEEQRLLFAQENPYDSVLRAKSYISSLEKPSSTRSTNSPQNDERAPVRRENSPVLEMIRRSDFERWISRLPWNVANSYFGNSLDDRLAQLVVIRDRLMMEMESAYNRREVIAIEKSVFFHDNNVGAQKYETDENKLKRRHRLIRKKMVEFEEALEAAELNINEICEQIQYLESYERQLTLETALPSDTTTSQKTNSGITVGATSQDHFGVQSHTKDGYNKSPQTPLSLLVTGSEPVKLVDDSEQERSDSDASEDSRVWDDYTYPQSPGTSLSTTNEHNSGTPWVHSQNESLPREFTNNDPLGLKKMDIPDDTVEEQSTVDYGSLWKDFDNDGYEENEPEDEFTKTVKGKQE